jgi:tetratricopeptide (TPR) repeat protein
MKRLLLAVIGIGVLGAMVFYLNRSKAPPVSAVEPAAESPASEAFQEARPLKPAVAGAAQPRRASAAASEARRASRSSPTPDEAKPDDNLAFSQAIETLLFPQASYPQKQAAWKQLRDTGKLDQAITELEQRIASDPRVAEYPATLGQAYLQKCGTIQDIREQGILAMKADQVFDAALSLDPSNWEARFTKAVAMSYWPTQLNKGQEVIEHFQTLVRQQEAQTPLPEFAQTYVWLGDQYQKAGSNDFARAVWQRGAALYPNDTALPKRLAQPAGK